MKQILSALLVAGLTLGMAQAQAQSTDAAPAKAAKKVKAKKSPAKKEAPAADATGTDEDDVEPDTTGSTSSDFHCELGNKLTIYRNAADDKHIALRWKQRLHRLTRVDTSTGADRFENRKFGLIWIGIPAKGMLLDSKKGRQLANECRNAEQMAPKS
jgi:hypothetical protein